MDPRKFSDLVIFNRVAEERSFTAAARSLGVSRDHVRYRMKKYDLKRP